MLEWLIEEVNRNLQVRKENLQDSAISPGFPKIILVKTTPKQAIMDFNGNTKSNEICSTKQSKWCPSNTANTVTLILIILWQQITPHTRFLWNIFQNKDILPIGARWTI